MKHILLLLLFLTCWGGANHLYSQPNQQPLGGYEEGVIYVKVADNSDAQLSFPPPSGSQNELIYEIFTQYGVTEVVKSFEVLRTSTLDRIYKVYFDPGNNVVDFMAKLRAVDYLEYSEQVPEKETFTTIPNDPNLPYQLGLIDAFNAFDLHQGGNTTVAIVDDAVQVSHEDLAANIVSGWDVADWDNDPNPPFSGTNAANANRFSHGTHVSGIAGAVTDNNIGIASIGWGNHLMAVKTVRNNTNNTNSITHGYEGIAWAAANGAEVINLSWGGYQFSQAEYAVVVAARQSGAIIVAAAGNNATTQPLYPAAYGSGTTGQGWEVADGQLVIAVASVDANGDRSDWGAGPFGQSGSNYGQWVDVSSYGTGIFSTVAGSSNGGPLNNQYGTKTGTSMAAPLVSGLIGLMASYNTNATDAEIINCLLGTANTDIYGPAHPNNLPGTLGSGRIDAFAALRCLATDCDDDPVAIITPTSHFICQNGSVQLAANTGIAYLWSTNATTQLITVTQAGTYTVTVTFPGNCTSSASIVIENAITEAIVITSENSGQHPNDGLLCGTDFLHVTAFWGLGYQWNTFGATTQTINNINAGNNLPFTWNYAVTVTGVGGCPGVTDVVTGTATWFPLPVAAIQLQENSQTPNDGIICNGASATLTASGGTSYEWSNGQSTAAIVVSPTVTTTFTVTITDVNGCTDEAQVQVQVVECPFDCPCTAANTLNITASAQGSLYSVLEAQFNYDQNNNGIIDQNEHHGCIAISGRLIIDQNLSIINCPNIRMQPCAEIVVQGQRTLTLTQNVITGCEQMWRGITVEAFGRLNFQRNEIQDAEHAITANGSWWFWPPVGNTSTIIDVQRNRFIRNHIGVFVPGPAGSNVAHAPFSRNDFIGNGGTPLLPPCTPALANWNADNGYAGVVIQGVTFAVGGANDVGITNTFSALRNGVIGESCWLQVHHASFTNMVGEWVNEGQTPGFASSVGMGVLSNLGFSTINDSYFDGCGHGIYSNRGFLAAFRNDMPSVRRGIEMNSPFACNLAENTDIVYRNKGIIARDLQTTSISQWLQYAVNKNVLRNFDQQNIEGDMAIEMRNGNQPDLVNARMSENKIYLNVGETGISIRGVGRWTLDQNYIQFAPFNNLPSGGLGFLLNASPRNYLYGNTVVDLASNGATSRGFNTANSTENVFCCNSTDGNRLGFRFFGACGSTTFRTSEMSFHETALEISLNGIMGDQGIFVPFFGGFFVNNRNWFGTSSGAAVHLATSNAVVNASRYHVLSTNSPDWPLQVSTQPGITDPWFYDDGEFDYTCSVCEVPPLVPDARGKEIDEADKILTDAGFGDYTRGLRMLQWEGSRSLYDRMKRFNELHNVNANIDAFYSNSVAGQIGQYYDADNLVNDLSRISTAMEADIADNIDAIAQVETDYNAKLNELRGAANLQDSLVIYGEAAVILMGARDYVPDLVQQIKTIQEDRITQAENALVAVSALEGEDLLNTNRKSVLEVYAQTIAQGKLELSAAQTATIKDIAYQCPEEGGSVVYLAQAIYQLVEPESFDDDELCIDQRGQPENPSRMSGGFEAEIIPNPASNNALIVLSQGALTGKVNIALIDAAGRTMLEKESTGDAGAIPISLADLPDGLYFCRIQVADIGVITRKLVVKQ